MVFLMALGAVLLALGAGAYWALVLSEGVYLGPRVVRLLYDRAAPRYDRIKNADPEDDVRYLARPLLTALDAAPAPLVLDVATGTARLPLSLMAEPIPGLRVVGIDCSPGMLGRAQRKLEPYPHVQALALADAGYLPFADDAFTAVTCLEAIEFTPRPRATLRELVRVLQPGGVLLISNRVGVDCLWFPDQRCGRGRVEAWLRELGLVDIEREAWQVYYDLVWAKKAA